MRSSLFLSVFVALALGFQATPSEAIRFRCGILAFFGNDRACRASCWVVGRKTGFCDEEGNCNCNPEDLNVRESIDNLLGGMDVMEYVSLKYREFEEEVSSWSLTKSVKQLVPSRCRLGNGFCEASCHGIGRVTGKCSADFSDCECSPDTVAAEQYALCLDDGVCSLYCQRQGSARGHCKGPTGWECRCYSNQDERPEDEYEFGLAQLKVAEPKV